MSGEMPGVDPEVLRTATAAFDEAVKTLNRMQADEPVGDAATAIGQLLTAEACLKAQAGISDLVTAAVQSVRQYGENLDAALHAYSVEDQAAAENIGNIDIPS